MCVEYCEAAAECETAETSGVTDQSSQEALTKHHHHQQQQQQPRHDQQQQQQSTAAADYVRLSIDVDGAHRVCMFNGNYCNL